MNAVVEPLPNCLATLRVEVGPDRVKSTRETLVHELLKDARIPGFRPGKAPRAVVEKRFQKQLSEDLESRVLNEGLQEAIKEKSLRVLQVQNVDDVRLEADAFSFSATLVMVPEFELPQYKGLEVSVPSEVVEEKAIARRSKPPRTPGDFVDSRRTAAPDGRFVVVDYKGTSEASPCTMFSRRWARSCPKTRGFWLE